MEQVPLVSVIVVNWNGEEYTRVCLNSLINQTYGNYEVIFVDNASTDRSPRIVKDEFPRVRLIINKENLGFAKGNNVAIRAAKGSLIALINIDTIADENWLSMLVDAATRAPEIGIVGSVVYDYNKESIWAAGSIIDALSGLQISLYKGEKKLDIIPESLDDIDYVAGTSLLIKREVVEKIGLLDEHYFLYWDDADWCLTAKRAGYTCKCVPTSTIYHVGGHSVEERPLFWFYNHHKSAIHFYLKHFPLKFLVSSLLFQFFVTIFRVVVLKRNVLCVPMMVSAFVWNLRHAKQIMVERESVNHLGPPIIKIRFREVFETVRKRVQSNETLFRFKLKLHRQIKKK